MTDIERSIGRIEGRQDAAEQQRLDLVRSLAQLNAKVDVLVEQMATASGAWKTLMAVGALSGSIGAVIASFFSGWFHK
jgi:hypothetical protein